LTKCHRSNNPINVVKATFDGLSRLKAIRSASPLPTGNQETGKTADASSSIKKS
jgi:ribosomal protein S5